MSAEKGGTAVRIWDLPLRLFHWLLVLSISVGAATGFLAPAWWLGVHVWAGYAVGALIVFRLIWAAYGSEYSRVASFLFSPRETIAHLAGIVRGRSSGHLGHNPAGAVMIFGLAALVSTIVVTGFIVLGGQEKHGVLAGVVSYATGHAAREIHQVLAFALLALVAAHVAGVVVESRLESENLALAMLTGRKRLAAGRSAPKMRSSRPLAALVTLAIVAALATAGGATLAGMPPLGLRDLPPNPVYAKECGACHHAFHPSLLPAASWDGMMAHLDDHFGEDASLPEATRVALAAWLVANASETWDSEAANVFRRVSPDEPWRITATRYWKRRHQNIDPTVFTAKAVGGKANCNACHGDASSGRYDDQAIAIPKEKS